MPTCAEDRYNTHNIDDRVVCHEYATPEVLSIPKAVGLLPGPYSLIDNLLSNGLKFAPPDSGCRSNFRRMTMSRPRQYRRWTHNWRKRSCNRTRWWWNWTNYRKS